MWGGVYKMNETDLMILKDIYKILQGELVVLIESLQEVCAEFTNISSYFFASIPIDRETVEIYFIHNNLSYIQYFS